MCRRPQPEPCTPRGPTWAHSPSRSSSSPWEQSPGPAPAEGWLTSPSSPGPGLGTLSLRRGPPGIGALAVTSREPAQRPHSAERGKGAGAQGRSWHLSPESQGIESEGQVLSYHQRPVMPTSLARTSREVALDVAMGLCQLFQIPGADLSWGVPGGGCGSQERWPSPAACVLCAAPGAELGVCGRACVHVCACMHMWAGVCVCFVLSWS